MLVWDRRARLPNRARLPRRRLRHTSPIFSKRVLGVVYFARTSRIECGQSACLLESRIGFGPRPKPPLPFEAKYVVTSRKLISS